MFVTNAAVLCEIWMYRRRSKLAERAEYVAGGRMQEDPGKIGRSQNARLLIFLRGRRGELVTWTQPRWRWTAS